MSGWKDARNILCVRLDAFGDVLMTEPALRALKQFSPARKITLLTSPAGAAAAALLPYLDDIIVSRVPWVKHAEPADGRETLALIEHLRQRQFDACVIFTVHSQNPLPTAMSCYLAAIPLRLAHCRENPYQLLTDWVAEREPQELVRHEVERQLALAAHAGTRLDDSRIRVAIPAAARRRASLLWAAAENAAAKILVHPGASAASRRYPPERFAEAMELIAAGIDTVFLLSGSSDETELTAQVAAEANVTVKSVAGQLTVPEWAALIQSADLLISNNTGSVHLAAATGTPVVDLYALTNPQHTPWRVRAEVLSHDVPCRDCYKSVCPQGHHRCLLGIDPQQVTDAALRLLIGSARATQRRAPESAQIMPFSLTDKPCIYSE